MTHLKERIIEIINNIQIFEWSYIKVLLKWDENSFDYDYSRVPYILTELKQLGYFKPLNNHLFKIAMTKENLMKIYNRDAILEELGI